MECNPNQNENEIEENSSSTNNSLNKINLYNRINNFEYSNCYNNLKKRSIEQKIILNISNMLTDICDNNSQVFKSDKNFKLVKPFITINPSIKIKDYLEQLYKYGRMNGSTIILMLIYIDRFCNINKIKLTHRIVHKLILSSLIVSIKYNEDEIYSLKVYSKIGGVTNAELEFLEECFISSVNFNLYVKEELFNKYYNYFADEDNDDDDDEDYEEEEEKEEKEEPKEDLIQKELKKDKKDLNKITKIEPKLKG